MLLKEAQRVFLEAVKAGSYLPIDWAAIRCESPGHTGILYVSADVLKIGEPDDFFRVNVSATTAQQIADVLNLMMPTAKICDLIQQNAVVRIEPCNRDVQGHYVDMECVPWMLTHSSEIEHEIGGRIGLASTLGKDWILCQHLAEHPDDAVNYGWYSNGAPHKPDYTSATGKMFMWQAMGSKHNRFHSDYSQTLRLVQPTMIVDGAAMLTDEVLRSKDLAAMISHEGPLMVTRQPGVEKIVPSEPPSTLRDPSVSPPCS